jgi:hypothetical protein
VTQAMRTRWIVMAGLAALLIGKWGTEPVMSQGREKTVINPVVHFPPLPNSIPELVASVDLVVLGRMVKGSAPRVEMDSRKQLTVRRTQHVEVVELVKGNGDVARAGFVTFFQGGGTVNVGSKQVIERPVVRLMEPGETAILFMSKRQDIPDMYHLAYGPASLLITNSDGTVALPTGMQAMPEMLNRKIISVDDLLALLRAATGS